MILSEIGIDMGDFKTSGNISSWAGMCPGNTNFNVWKIKISRYVNNL